MFLLFRTWRLKAETKTQVADKNTHLDSQKAQLQSLESKYNKLLEQDSLTGLKNRQYLNTFISDLTAQKPQDQWCMLLIDIDSFKKINDDYGHQAGDDVLLCLSNLLKSIKGPEDIMARWGGEEFLWLAKSTTENTGQQHCSQLQESLSKEVFKAQGFKLKISCSLGFSNFPIQEYKALDWDWAIKLSTNALYKAKETGANQWLGLSLNKGKVFDYSSSAEVQEMIDCGLLELIEKSNNRN
jgi:diguanylate cyclase (GGDEF)-like protein